MAVCQAARDRQLSSRGGAAAEVVAPELGSSGQWETVGLSPGMCPVSAPWSWPCRELLLRPCVCSLHRFTELTANTLCLSLPCRRLLEAEALPRSFSVCSHPFPPQQGNREHPLTDVL